MSPEQAEAAVVEAVLSGKVPFWLHLNTNHGPDVVACWAHLQPDGSWKMDDYTTTSPVVVHAAQIEVGGFRVNVPMDRSYIVDSRQRIDMTFNFRGITAE